MLSAQALLLAGCGHFKNIFSGFVEHLSVTLGAQQSVTKIISLAVVNFVTPKAGARLLCNEGASGVGLINI